MNEGRERKPNRERRTNRRRSLAVYAAGEIYRDDDDAEADFRVIGLDPVAVHGPTGQETSLGRVKCKALLLSSLLLLCIMLLSIPNVPERFLGVHSPEQVQKSFSLSQNKNNDSGGSIQQIETKQHSIQKRHVLHKFWARARLHSKFLRISQQRQLQHVKGIANKTMKTFL